MYEQGFGVPPSQADAIDWYRKAGKQGLVQARVALHNLGVD